LDSLYGHQLNFCAIPMGEETKNKITTVTSRRIAAATTTANSWRMAMPVMINGANTEESTSPKLKMVTKILSIAVVMASLSRTQD
jgi:hypothetical protein